MAVKKKCAHAKTCLQWCRTCLVLTHPAAPDLKPGLLAAARMARRKAKVLTGLGKSVPKRDGRITAGARLLYAEAAGYRLFASECARRARGR